MNASFHDHILYWCRFNYHLYYLKLNQKSRSIYGHLPNEKNEGRTPEVFLSGKLIHAFSF